MYITSPAVFPTGDPPAGANPRTAVKNLLGLACACSVGKCLWTPGTSKVVKIKIACSSLSHLQDMMVSPGGQMNLFPISPVLDIILYFVCWPGAESIICMKEQNSSKLVKIVDDLGSWLCLTLVDI